MEMDHFPGEGRISSSTSRGRRRLSERLASLLGLSELPRIPHRPHRYFVSSDRHNDSVDPDLNSDDEENEEISSIKKSLLEVKKVDFKESSNAFLSHTDKYDIVSPPTGPKNLVIRRGEDFKFVVTFYRPYNEEEDVVSIVFETGKTPKDADGTRVVLPLKEGGKPQSWKLNIETVEENWVEVRVTVPATCCIGKWSFRISTVDKENFALKEWVKTTPIYVLFNPWCEEDTVYHPDEEFRKDYLLEDDGQIYVGHYTPWSGANFRDWDFAQFDDPVLKCVLLLLEKKGLRTSAFSDPVKVVRKLTSVVNSLDNQGLLAGNWSGSYAGGASPLSWNGSKKIMTEYYRTKSPVNYGQCWVFSGVLTTCLRALGIPARCVTNSNSAHDTDGSLTIDRYYRPVKTEDNHSTLEYDENLTTDSIWNFHVWNDAWMSRPDLDGEYREPAWQACDATPQETSDGFYSCGPCPVKAIKNGDVNVGYDGPFIFAEVNGDVIRWIYHDFNDCEFNGLNKHSVGTALLTSRNRKMVNVLEEYKFLDDENEKNVTLRASHFIPEHRRKMDYSQEEELVLELTDIKEVMYGDPYEVVVKVTNRFFTDRTVSISIKTQSCYYTGIIAKKIKSHYTEEFLSHGERFYVQSAAKVIHGREKPRKKDKPGKIVKFPITFEEYEPAIVERCIFKTLMVAEEYVSYKKFIAEDEFILSKPTIIAKANPSKVKVGEKVEVSISFVNSLPKSLTQCVLSVEGIGLQNPIEFNTGPVGPKETFTWEMIIHPFKPNGRGPRRLLFDFDSLEIVDIKGSCEIDVHE